MSSNVHLAFFTVGIIFLVAFLIYLALRAGRGYSVKDTQTHAETFGGVVQEGHGGITVFVFITVTAIIVWSVIYLIMHWSQFAIVFFR